MRKLQRAGYFPSLTASAGISTGFSSEANGAYSNQLNDGLYPTAGLSLSIPIYQKKQEKQQLKLQNLVTVMLN